MGHPSGIGPGGCRQYVEQKKSAVQGQFGRQAGAYARSERHARDRDLLLLIEHLHLQPDDRALDVATGTGFTAFALQRRVRSVVGVDLTHRMLQEARRLAGAHAGIDWVEGDAEALPFRTAVFTVVTCRRAPHHFPRVDRAVAEMLRVLEPGGRLGIVDQVPPEDDPGHRLMGALEVLRDGSHVRALPASEWEGSLTRQGLRRTFVEIVERRQTVDAWLDLAGPTDAVRSGVKAMLADAPRAAREQLGYEDDPPSFLKRWIVIVGRTEA